MGKETPTFVVTRRLYLEPYQYDFLNKKMDVCNRIYNIAAKHCIALVKLLYEDLWYKESIKQFRASKDEDESKAWAAEIFACMAAYGLTEYDIHKHIGVIKKQVFEGGINIDVAQKVGSNLYAAVKKAVFAGSTIHYRKYGQTNSFEAKKASGIIYNKKTDTVKVFGKVLKTKPIRESDEYMKKAMTCKVKYCMIVRKPYRNGYRYFVQLALEGTSPKVIKLGSGKCGTDLGTSTIAYYNDTEANFEVIADGVEKYEKAIKKAAVKYERRLRLANPDCYNPDGTLKTGCKLKSRTKGSQKALMELKAAYWQKTMFVTQGHNAFANRFVRQTNYLIKEPMDYRKLLKRARNTSNQQKPKDGRQPRKKRFGTTINRRSPGLLQKIIVDKIERNGGYVLDVNLSKYKASQYDHITQIATKSSLSNRTKEVGGHTVQRDLYSSYLLYNAYDEETINFDSCTSLFNDYLNKQNTVVNKIKTQGDKTKNFGLKAFIL